MNKNKRASIPIYVLVIMTLFTCITSLFLLNTTNKPVLAISADVESLMAAKEQKDSYLLWLKIGIDDLIIKDYEATMKETAIFVDLSGVKKTTPENANYFFLEKMKFYLQEQTKSFNVAMLFTSKEGAFTFVKPDFKVSSGVRIKITEFTEGGKLLGEEKITERNSILWAYTAPLTYQISLSELGLDSYEQIHNVLNELCSYEKTISLEEYRNCLAFYLKNWQFSDNSVILEKLVDAQTKQEQEFYKVNFVSKRAYTQFSPARPISFSIYVEKK